MTARYVLARLYLYFLFVLFFITGGLAMFVLAPLYKSAFVPRASYGDLRPFSLWKNAYRVAWRTLTSKKYRDAFPGMLATPPMAHTDLSWVRVRDDWPGEEKNCDACKAACCAQVQCPLVDAANRCMSYNSLFFNYLYCGRYPQTQPQIDYYSCPKWELAGKASAPGDTPAP